MQKNDHTPDLQNESLKRAPFAVPEGYFETFPERIRERIVDLESHNGPQPRAGRKRIYRISTAIAAVLAALALITYSLIRFTSPAANGVSEYPDVALLEEMGIIDDDIYLVGLVDADSEPMDDDEAYINQAIQYLAISDVEVDLILE